MIKRLIWTIWTPMSSVLKKADKLNLSLSRHDAKQASSGWDISICGRLNSSVTCSLVVPRQVVCCAVFLPYSNLLTSMLWIVIFKMNVKKNHSFKGTVMSARGQKSSERFRSIPSLLMPWLFASPVYQQPWYWQVFRINGSLSSTWKDLNYLHLISVAKWLKMLVYFCLFKIILYLKD